MKTGTRIATCVAILTMVVSRHAAAQPQGSGMRFPSVAQVTVDFPDDAERFIAFDFLFQRLNQATKGSGARTDYELANAYFTARGQLLTKYEQQGNSSQAYKTFTDRTGSLFRDPSFRQSILDKYGLNEPLVSQLFPERKGDRSDAEIKAAFSKALPVWAGDTLAMVGLMWVLMRYAGDKTVKAPRTNPVAGLPQLPESLRQVSVAGRRYEVSMTSGLGQGQVVSVIERPLPGGSNDALLG